LKRNCITGILEVKAAFMMDSVLRFVEGLLRSRSKHKKSQIKSCEKPAQVSQ